MTVLSDREILDLVGKGQLVETNFRPENMTPNGYDLTAARIEVEGSEKYYGKIGSKRHFLVSSQEVVNLPANIMGMLWIRSSFARKGIIGSFGAVDAGFRGNLTLSLYNASENVFSLNSGERIVQIVFLRLTEGAERDYSSRSGHYQNSSGIVHGRG